MNKSKNINSSVEYQTFLSEVVTLVSTYRTKAVEHVQVCSNNLYWHIGELIINKQKEYNWGFSVVEQLSYDLNNALGKAVSWSPRNLWFMRQIVEEYSILKQPVSELESLKNLITAVPWGHNILIIQKVKEMEARKFYLKTTVRNKYSRSVLAHQIQADAYNQYLANPSQHNFTSALPEHLVEQTRESIKSVYSLDFLDLNKPISERQLEFTMVEKVKRLIMELGYGFCFIGNQYSISLGEKDYYIDLLFYHRILKCLIAVELKITEFEPEYTPHGLVFHTLVPLLTE